MDTPLERERGMQQQRSADRLRDLALKNRGARDDVERKRLVDPRERAAERSVLDRERSLERQVMMDLPGRLVDKELKAANVPLGRMVGRDARLIERDGHKDSAQVHGRLGPVERMRASVSREREDDRLPDTVVGVDIPQDRDLEREESMRELVSSYKSALAELTFNSKPIITNLTIIAGENTHAAKVISSTVFNHIMEVPKEQKLPSLYLLDSIVKNIGGGYIKYFAARLPEVFCTAYRQVDPGINPAMQHLFKTWRGVFPAEPLRQIENDLQISSSAPNGQSGGTPPARLTDSPVPQPESPMPRTGHGIHVNPKYLEAQRQRLQQSGGQVASRGKRDEYEDPELVQEGSFDFDYGDYGRSNVRSTGRTSLQDRATERTDAWGAPGFYRDQEGEDFGHDEGRSPRSRYGLRNGYEWRQLPARNSDGDGYGYNRGAGPGRGHVRSAQAAVRDARGGRGGPGNWLKAEEEEYAWEDMSPRQPLQRDDRHNGDRLSKEGWFPSETGRVNSVGESGRLKRTSQDAGFADDSGWRRSGPGAQLEQAHIEGDRRPSQEYDEKRGIAGHGSGLTSRGPIPSTLPNSGWQSQVNSSFRNLSPPARTRPGTIPLSVANNNITRPSINLVPRGGAPSTVGNSLGLQVNSGNRFESRQIPGPAVGGFGGNQPGYHNPSTVTPAPGMSFQQRQQPIRPPPSPSHPHQPQYQQTPLTTSQPSSEQIHLQMPHEQSSQPPARHQIHASAQQHQSSQSLPLTAQSLQNVLLSQAVPPPMQGGQQSISATLQHLGPQQGQSQLPALQQSQLLPSIQQGVHQPPLSQLHSQSQNPLPQVSIPVLPLISSQLAQSLQQLAAQQAQQTQQQAPSATAQPPPQASQSLNLLPQTLAPAAANGSSGGSAQLAEAPSQNNNLLAAIFQSGFIPTSQASQITPQSQAALSRVTAAPVQVNSSVSNFQGHPPLPTGPPPLPFANSMGTAPTVQGGFPGQMSSVVSTTISQGSTFGIQGPRYPQPPLPPGPPPGSSMVGAGTNAPAVGTVLSSSISSLLSSLVAHGVIGAPGQKTSTTLVPNPSGAFQPNTNFVSVASVASVGPSSIAAGPAAVASLSVVVPGNAPHSPPRLKEVTLNLGFKQEFLRERHEFVLEALYSEFPRQCKTCGLRFKAQDEHSKHMDWHVSRNRRQKSQKKVSRKWFVSVKEWLSGTSAAALEFAPSFFAEEHGVKDDNNELIAVPADENQSACALCGELFEYFYSDETDEWMYKGAVYLNVPQGGSTEGLDGVTLGPIVHVKCKTESAETGTGTIESVDDDGEVQPELQAADSVRMEIDGNVQDSVMPLLTDNFDMPDVKEEEKEEEGSRRKRTRY